MPEEAENELGFGNKKHLKRWECGIAVKMILGSPT